MTSLLLIGTGHLENINPKNLRAAGGHTVTEWNRLLAETARINRLPYRMQPRQSPRAATRRRHLMPFEIRRKLRALQHDTFSARNDRDRRKAWLAKFPHRLTQLSMPAK